MHRTNFFQGYSRRRSKHIQAQTCQKVERQDVKCLQWCLQSSLSPQEKENHTTDQQQPGDSCREWHRPFHERGEDLHPVARPSPSLKFAEDPSSALTLARMCDGVECFCSWQPGGNQKSMKGKWPITCCTETFVPLVAVTQQQPLHLSGTTPPGGPLCQIKKWNQPMPKWLEPFSECLIDDDAILIRSSPLAQKKRDRGDPIAGTEPLAVATDAGLETLTPKTKKREATIPNLKGTTECSRISQNIRIVKCAG